VNARQVKRANNSFFMVLRSLESKDKYFMMDLLSLIVGQNLKPDKSRGYLDN
jgi:hypothetical protein